MRYPDGEWVTTSYLRQKLPNSVSGTGVYVQATHYDAAGRLELRLLGADQVRIDPYYRSWDTQGGRLHWLIGRVGSAGAYLQALEYAYDSVGAVSWIKDNLAGGVQTHSFSYDSMDRLLSASAAPAGDGGEYSESYSYDSAGRLVNGPRGSGYVYGDAAHKHAVTAVSGGHSYAYDANGAMVSRTSGGQTLSFTYDAENRLVGVGGAVSASFVYDGDGRRVKATVNGVTSYYVGDHYEVSGGVVKKYYTAGGQRIAMRSGGTLSWLLNDHLGGTAHTVSGTAETGEVRYRAFGVTRFTSGVTPTTYRFTGQREEAALGLYYYNARWCDPTLGHFLSPDAIVPEAGNALDYHRYAYVRFNPLKYSDPSGHQAACMMGANGSLSCSPNTTMGGRTLTVDMEIPTSPQRHSLPVSPVVVNAPHMNAPTPTQAPRLAPAPPFPPTAAPPPPGDVNQSDLYWSGAMALADDIPESLGHSGIVRAAGRGVGQFIPIVGYGASVGPNLGKHLLAGDPAEDTIADFATDSLGFGASILGGNAGRIAGSTITTAIAPEAAPVAIAVGGAVGSFVGGTVTSIGWDVYIAPTVSNWFLEAWDRITASQ
jgi:RHS repeat-associated protein